MGMDSTAVSFLCAAKSMGANFDNTAMIGRQSFYPDLSTLQRVFSVLGLDRKCANSSKRPAIANRSSPCLAPPKLHAGRFEL